MEKDSMSLWGSQTSGIRKWNAIRQSAARQVMLGTRNKTIFASVEHHQTNGQVESTNRVLFRGLKRRLEKTKGAWAEEVP